MFSLRPSASRFVCNACKNSARKAQRMPHNGTKVPLSVKKTFTATNWPRREFSSTTRLTRGKNDPATEDPEFAFLEREAPSIAKESDAQDAPEPAPQAPETSASQSIPPTPASDSIPWYLRQQASVPQVQQPALIPDLPPNPPPLLHTILEYISITAGLDDLELLDLRHIDPPPALGPKLIMIIATARSEKHLHVAADRFARWLRREHGLRANAAGLLGRNELKIKLRRKAKRMRMLANVGGALPEGNIDDGIRTGWICCTLSKIEAHPDDTHMPGDNVEEFVGFRDVKPGVNVVVQMFTEEKRADTDLETLWGGVMKTHKRKNQAVDDELGVNDIPEESSAEDATPTPVAPFVFKRPQPTAGDPFPGA